MDKANPYSPQPIASSKSSEEWTPPTPTFQDQADRRRSTWISTLCRQVLSSYRRDDFADPEGFLVQLGMVLERYPDAVIRDVTSPFTGIQRRSKFPPSIAEVVQACDDEAARAERIRRMGPPIPVLRVERVPQHRANVFVPAANRLYPKMLEKSATADPMEWRLDDVRPGIWVALGWLDDNKASSRKAPRHFTTDDLRRIYARHDGAAGEAA